MMENSAPSAKQQPAYRILFVCLGNICRSPLAEGVFRSVVDQAGRSAEFEIDSAGTGGWHAGSRPDPRSVAVAARHGIDISSQRARKVTMADFDRFNLILGMDVSNVATLRRLCGNRHPAIAGFIEFSTGFMRDVPDPYFGGSKGFDDVYRMILEASQALSAKLERPASPPSSGQASSTT